MDKERIMDVAEAWVRAACRRRAAEIDAGACGTALDFKHLHEAEQAEWNAKGEFERILGEEAGHG